MNNLHSIIKSKFTRDDLYRKAPSIFAESSKETLSDKYLQIPTYKILDGLLDNGFQVREVKEQRQRSANASRDHAKHVIMLTHDHIDGLQVGEGLPMIRLENSHNGLSSFQISSAFHRLVCDNGLLMPENEFSSAKIRHHVNMKNDVIEACYKIVKSMPEQLAIINEMKSIKLNPDERHILAEHSARMIYDDELLELNAKHKIDVADKLLRARNWEDRKNSDNLWSTFNIIQENAIKGGVNVLRESGFRKTKKITGIDADKKLNHVLMSLAQEMKNIKQFISA